MNKKFIDVICGSMFSYFITFDYHIYASGLNDYNQLGLNNNNYDDVFEPKKIHISNYPL